MRTPIILTLFTAACAAAWLTVDRLYAAAPYEGGGPVVAKLSDCRLPPPSEDAATVLAGYYEGAAISNVRLKADNRQENKTTALDVRIAPGFRPIYLVVVGDRNSILRFKGWTSRIEQLVIVTRKPYPVGVTGMPRSRILFVEDCGVQAAQTYDEPEVVLSPSGRGHPFDQLPLGDMSAMGAASVLTAPDVMGGGYDPAVLTIGAGSIGAKIYAAHDYDKGLPDWQQGYATFDPAGVYDIDMDSLVAPVPAEPYRQLPGWLGLAQLVRDGKLERTGSDSFRVLAPIRAPAGLAGSQSVIFQVPYGQSAPSGDLGHSRIHRD